MTTTAKVYLMDGYFINEKRRDGKTSAILLYKPEPSSPRRLLTTVELIAEDRDELDVKVAEWAQEHASNIEELAAKVPA